MLPRLFIFFLCLVSVSQAADALRFIGSDLLTEPLSQLVDALNTDTDTRVGFTSQGSLPAMDQLQAGEIDVAVIAVPEGQAVPSGEFVTYPLVYSVSVVLLNEENPTNELSLPQLAGIFGASEELKLRNWGELGLAGWTNRSFRTIVSQKDGGITVELFKHEVLKAGGLKSTVMSVREDELVPLIRSDLSTIAVATRMQAVRGLKELMISTANDLPAYEASRDNVHFGDYPIRLPYYIVFKSEDAAKVKPLLKVLFGTDASELFEQYGLIALPDTVRRKLEIDLELAK